VIYVASQGRGFSVLHPAAEINKHGFVCLISISLENSIDKVSNAF